MKLRVRSLVTKETEKIEVPNSCSLLQFKQLLSQTIPSSSPFSLHLSLNRKDEIQASSPEESLQSLGITTGDLIFYTVDSNPFSNSSETLAPSLSIQEPPPKNEDLTAPTVSAEVEMDDALDGSGDCKDPILPVQNEEYFGVEALDMLDDGSIQLMGKRNSEPCFIKRVLNEEMRHDLDDQMMLVLGVHAVILDSGFVLCDGVSGLQVGRNHFPNEWPSSASALSLWYSLPENVNDASTVKYTVILKFMNLGNVVMIYGSLSNGGGVHMVNLEKYKFAKAVGSMLTSCTSSSGSIDNGANRDEGEFFNFWKIVKDGLALPLLIDLCEKCGLESPPCFMRLPTELKLKILEYLTGVDVAKVACVCSEMQYLSSNNDLWRQKFEEEFGGGQGAKDVSYWKELFAGHWDAKKKAQKAIIVKPTTEGPNLPPRVIRDPNPFNHVIRDPFGIPTIYPNPFGFPDRLPGSGVLPPFRQLGSTLPRLQPRRTFSPPCNLREFNT